MKPRLQVKKVASCTPDGVLISYQTAEEVAKQVRRREFFKLNCTASMFLYAINVKKRIQEFKKEKYGK